MNRISNLLLIAAAIGSFATSASAAPAVSLDSAVFVERAVPGMGRMLEPASELTRGDRVVYVVRWYKLAGDGGFVVTNPLPRSVYYQGSSNGDEEVSIDGGRSWGKLGMIRTGERIATPEDVTHVRWRVDPRAASRGQGRIAYSAIVR